MALFTLVIGYCSADSADYYKDDPEAIGREEGRKKLLRFAYIAAAVDTLVLYSAYS